MARWLLFSGAIVMALAVALGAVSSHAAKGAVHPEAARLLQTAVLYQMIHGIGIVIAGTLARSGPRRLLAAAGILHLLGVAAFCGSLYVLAFSGVSLGVAAPLGGVAFIAGWLALAAYALRAR
jgi:uncharacterized membrane protein YgdD (TMEM256/DUF423 family)